ncbi:MAG: hypothetical protein KA810_10570 [Pyrinomonadaceae bacterium]|nr:hypothetical protein [Pyrinomonadaceae bacterium]
MRNRTVKLSKFVLVALLAVSIFAAVGCGKRGAPVPPKERVSQRAELAGFQRGNQVILSWQMPARNAPAGNVQHIARIDVYRLAEPADAPLQLSTEQFADRSTLITTIPVTAADFGLKTLQYRDTLLFATQSARLRYALRYVNEAGQKAAFSNALVIEPAAKVASAPASLSGEPTQDAVILKWNAPAANIDGTTPVNVLGYNIYRSISEKEPAKLLNKVPVSGKEFSDETFEFNKDYFYFVRAVSPGTQAEPVESGESNVLKFKALDNFAPAAPAAITLAASPNTISIFFAANLERDIAGYKIYRTTVETEDKAKWQLITPELLKTNTFQDTKVESGQKYFYYITATDTTGNVSERSEVVSETVP